MKRIVSLLLTVCLLMSLSPEAASAEEAWPYNCTLTISCNGKAYSVDGLYLSNAFYVMPADLLQILPGMDEIYTDSAGHLRRFSTNYGMRTFSVPLYLASNNTFELQEYIAGELYDTGVPYLFHHSDYYISLLHYANYLGVDFTFSPVDPDAQLYLTPQQTIYDVLADLYESGYDTPFAWEDVHFTQDDMLSRLEASAVVSLLRTHPVWSLSVLWQERACELYAKDVLIRILQLHTLEEGIQQDANQQKNEKDKLTFNVVLNTVIRLLPATSKNDKQLAEALQYAGTLQNASGDVVDTLRSLSRYLSFSQADAQLLQRTLCSPYASASPTLQGNEQFLQIAQELQHNISSTDNALSATIGEEIVPAVTNLILSTVISSKVNAAARILSFLDNASFAADLFSLEFPLLNNSQNLFSFAIANEVARAAREIRLAVERDLSSSRFVSMSSSERMAAAETLKASIILQLRADLLSYQLLKESHTLPEKWDAFLSSHIQTLGSYLANATDAVLRWPLYHDVSYALDLNRMELFTVANDAPISCNGSASFYSISRGEVFDETFDIDGDGIGEYLFFDSWADKSYEYLQFLPSTIDRQDAQSYSVDMQKEYPYCFPDKQFYNSYGWDLRPEYQDLPDAQANEYVVLTLHTGDDGRLYLGIGKVFRGATGWPDMYVQFYQQDSGTELTYIPINLSGLLLPSDALAGYYLGQSIVGLNCEYNDTLQRWCLTIQQIGNSENDQTITVETCFTLANGEPVFLARYADGKRVE